MGVARSLQISELFPPQAARPQTPQCTPIGVSPTYTRRGWTSKLEQSAVRLWRAPGSPNEITFATTESPLRAPVPVADDGLCLARCPGVSQCVQSILGLLADDSLHMCSQSRGPVPV
eukprot:6484834-Amphidinium_carterae.1